MVSVLQFLAIIITAVSRQTLSLPIASAATLTEAQGRRLSNQGTLRTGGIAHDGESEQTVGGSTVARQLRLSEARNLQSSTTKTTTDEASQPPDEEETSYFICEGPSQGCENGLWNQDKCQCDCIQPYCHDNNGECKLPNDSCGGNPWKDCELGKDCPWWVNQLKAESCATGNEVPPGVYTIFPTKTTCCQVGHPYSNVCDPLPVMSSPTQSPTIAPDLYEVVPIKFSLKKIPNVVKIKELKEEMYDIFKRILTDLSDRMGSLKITSLEEKVMEGRNFLRRLQQSLDVYYDVTVLRDPDRSFGPIIIQWIRDSYNEIVKQIQQYTDEEYFGTEIDMSWCTSEEGDAFTLCNDEIVPVKMTLKDADIPVEELAQKIIETYQEILADVDELEVTFIEAVDIVRLPNGNVDVLFDIHASQKFGIEFAPIINQTIASNQDAVLREIQSYSDEVMVESNLNWCQEEDIFTICEAKVVLPTYEPPPAETASLPLWTIIMIVGLGILFCCVVSAGILTYIKTRSAEKNEINMVSYLHTGSGVKKNGRRSTDQGQIFEMEEPRIFELEKLESKKPMRSSQGDKTKSKKKKSERRRRDSDQNHAKPKRRNSEPRIEQLERRKSKRSNPDDPTKLRRKSSRRRSSLTRMGTLESAMTPENESKQLEGSSRRSSLSSRRSSRKSSRSSLTRLETLESALGSENESKQLEELGLYIEGMNQVIAAVDQEEGQLVLQHDHAAMVNNFNDAEDPPELQTGYQPRRSSRSQSIRETNNQHTINSQVMTVVDGKEEQLVLKADNTALVNDYNDIQAPSTSQARHKQPRRTSHSQSMRESNKQHRRASRSQSLRVQDQSNALILHGENDAMPTMLGTINQRRRDSYSQSMRGTTLQRRNSSQSLLSHRGSQSPSVRGTTLQRRNSSQTLLSHRSSHSPSVRGTSQHTQSVISRRNSHSSSIQRRNSHSQSVVTASQRQRDSFASQSNIQPRRSPMPENQLEHLLLEDSSNISDMLSDQKSMSVASID